MADSYLSIAAIATDPWMARRLFAATTQQAHLGNVPEIANPTTWVLENAYVWASSPGWGEAWDYAVAMHPADASYEPGKDSTVITDAMILTAVQDLGT